MIRKLVLLSGDHFSLPKLDLIVAGGSSEFAFCLCEIVNVKSQPGRTVMNFFLSSMKNVLRFHVTLIAQDFDEQNP